MRSVRARDLKSVVFTGTVLLILLLAQAVSAAGRLFIGTDENAFANGELAVVNTDCATADIFSGRIITLNFPLNGVAAGPGFLWAGQPLTVGASPGNTLRVVSENEASTASPVFTIPAGNPAFSADCCNEQMVSAPDGAFYHAHWPDVIQRLRLDVPAKSVVLQTYPQEDVVGMATDGTQIWISKWGAAQVGTWDPGTNTFTPVFSTPGLAGALAWDVACGVLWVGLAGGDVIPYDASGNQVGPAIQPFGFIGATIDGMAFVPN